MLLYRCGSVYLKCTQLSLTFEYFELNNIYLVSSFWSVVTLPHIPKDHISRNICINWEISNIVDWIFSGPGGYFTGGGILYYTIGKFTQNPELHQRQKQQ